MTSMWGKTWVAGEISLPTGTSVFCLTFPRGFGGALYTLPVYLRRARWLGLSDTPLEHPFGELPSGKSIGGLLNVNQIIGAGTFIFV